MAATDAKFSTFVDGGDLDVNDTIVGLRNGLNARFKFVGAPGLYLPIAGGTMEGVINMNGFSIDNILSTSYRNNGFTVTFAAPTLAGNSSYVWPNATPGVNGYVLSCSTTGVMSWVPNTAGSMVSVVGTANEIDVDSTDPQNPVLSLSATMDLPGTFNIQSTTAVDEILDEDDMSSDSPTALATQQSIKAYVDSLPGGQFNQVNIQSFAASGTYTPSAGLIYAIVEGVAAGGGGGGGTGTSGAGGGGGGGYFRRVLTAAQIGASQTVTIGVGGAGGTAGNNGSPGGTTSFGALISATGGSGGNAANGTNGGPGGTEGVGSNGDVNQDGGMGASGGIGTQVGGSGGNSYYGGGGRGGTPAAAAASGQANGGGGGGAQGGGTGASGADGFVNVIEFLSI